MICIRVISINFHSIGYSLQVAWHFVNLYADITILFDCIFNWSFVLKSDAYENRAEIFSTSHTLKWQNRQILCAASKKKKKEKKSEMYRLISDIDCIKIHSAVVSAIMQWQRKRFVIHWMLVHLNRLLWLCIILNLLLAFIFAGYWHERNKREKKQQTNTHSKRFAAKHWKRIQFLAFIRLAHELRLHS